MGKGSKDKQVDWIDRVEIILGLGLREKIVLTEQEKLDIQFLVLPPNLWVTLECFDRLNGKRKSRTKDSVY